MGWRKTVTSENTKTLRQAVDAVIGVDASTQSIWSPTFSSTDTLENWYGAYTYKNNFKYWEICKKSPILMDFANGGFINNGKAEPISSDTFSDPTGYGLIVASPSANYAYVKIRLVDSATKSGDYLTVCAKDSEGNLYYATKDVTTTGAYNFWILIYKSDFTDFPTDERLYILWVAYGDAWVFDNSSLVDCTVNLRGVETKIDNPELQMSEIEVNAYSSTQYGDKLLSIATGTPIQYTAGYPGDMSTVRTFYVNDRVTQDVYGKINITGYDATTFLDGDWEGDYTHYWGNNTFRGTYVKLQSNIIQAFRNNMKEQPNTNDWYNDVEFDETGSSSSYGILDSDTTIREHIARFVNVGRATEGGYLGNAFYFDYVDAGYPMFVGNTTRYRSVYYKDSNVNFGDENFSIPKNQISEFSNNYDSGFKTLKLTSYVGALGDATTVKSNITASSDNVSKWFKFDDPVPVVRFYKTDGSGADLYDSKVLTKYLRRVCLNIYKYTDDGLASSFYIKTRTLDWTTEKGAPFTASGSGTGTITLPDMYIPAYTWQSEDGSVAHSSYSNMLNHIAQRSLITYEFTWRGHPKMQPRDLISANSITMTVDSLTLEHTSGGGFSSKVTARKGWM